MAKKEEQNSEATGVGGSTTQEGTQLKIRWDSSNMRSAYANVFNAAGTREEIVLFFGMNQSWDVTLNCEYRLPRFGPSQKPEYEE